MRQREGCSVHGDVALFNQVRHERLRDVGGEAETVADRVAVGLLGDDGRGGIHVALDHVSAESRMACHCAFTIHA